MVDKAYPYDVKFTIDGTEYGFMLVSPDGETKQISSSEQIMPQNLSRVQTQDIANYQDFNPLYDTPFVMADWSAGLGYFNHTVENGYFWATRVSTHREGSAYPGPGNEQDQSLTSTIDEIPQHIAIDPTFANNQASGNAVYFVTREQIFRVYQEESLIGQLTVDRSTNNGGTDPDAEISDVAIFNNHLIYSSENDSSSFDYWRMFDLAGAMTNTNIEEEDASVFNDAKPRFLEVVRDTLYASVEENKIYFTTDATDTSSWVGPITVGENTHALKGLMAVNNFLFVIKDDAIYSIDSEQEVEEVIWQWKDRPNSDNFKHFTSLQNFLVYTVGNEVWLYQPETGANFPTGVSRYDSFALKEIMGLAADDKYIYLLARVKVENIRKKDTLVILRGFNVGENQWAWENFWEVDTDFHSESWGPMFITPALAKGDWQFRGHTLILFNDNDGSDGIDFKFWQIPSEWNERSSLQDYGIFSEGWPPYNTDPHPERDPDDFVTNYLEEYVELYTSIYKSGFPGFLKRHLYFNLDVDDISYDMYDLDTNPGNEESIIEIHFSKDEGKTWERFDWTLTESFEKEFDDAISKSIMFRFIFIHSNGRRDRSGRSVVKGCEYVGEYFDGNDTHDHMLLYESGDNIYLHNWDIGAYTIEKHSEDSAFGITYDGTFWYVVDTGDNQVIKLDPDGGTNITWGQESTWAFPAGRNLLDAVYVSDSDTIFFTDIDNDEIVELNKDTGSVISSFSIPGGFATLTYDTAKEEFWIRSNDELKVYNSSGTLQKTLPSPVPEVQSDGITYNFDTDEIILSSRDEYFVPINKNTGNIDVAPGAEIRNFDHHQRVIFKYLPTQSLQIRLADKIELRNRNRSNKTVQDLWDDLVTIRTSNDTVNYKDFLGNDFEVSIDQLTNQLKQHEEADNKYEQIAELVVTRADRGVNE